MKISRIARIGAIGAVAALALAGCAANEGGTGGSTTPPLDSAALRHLDGHRRLLAAGRPAGLDRRVPDRQPRRHGQLHRAGFGHWPRELPSPGRCELHRLRPRVQRRRGRQRAASAPAPTAPTIVEIPVYISPVAVAFNLDGIDELNLDGETIAKIFAGKITHWNDPAIATQNEGVDASRPGDHHRAPLRPLGHAGDLHQVPRAVAPDVWTYEASDEWPLPTRRGRQTAPRVSSNAITNGSGYIGFADASRTSELGQVAVEVEGDVRRTTPPTPPPRSSTPRRSRRAAPTMTSRSPSTRPPRPPAPTRSPSSLPHRLRRRTTTPRRRRPREGVLRVRRLAPRARTPRVRAPAAHRSRTACATQISTAIDAIVTK